MRSSILLTIQISHAPYDVICMPVIQQGMDALTMAPRCSLPAGSRNTWRKVSDCFRRPTTPSSSGASRCGTRKSLSSWCAISPLNLRTGNAPRSKSIGFLHLLVLAHRIRTIRAHDTDLQLVLQSNSRSINQDITKNKKQQGGKNKPRDPPAQSAPAIPNSY